MKRLSVFLVFIALCSVSAFAGGTSEQGASKAVTITMWMQNYGNDLNTQQKIMSDLATKFQAETGIKVDVEIGNWTEASKKWLLVATGGDHPDVGDMWWAWSNVQIGKGKYGPMPLDQYKDQLHLDNFYPSALADVTYNGHIYGIPWRIDVRPMLYRVDLFQQAGLSGPPDNWQQLVTDGQKLTQRNADGNITLSGVGFHYGVKNDSQDFLHWIWQGGGEATSADGKTATLNSKQVVDSMQFVRDLVYKYGVVSKDVLDPSYDGMQLFLAGRIAIQPHGTSSVTDMPKEMVPKIRPAIPTQGVRRTAYSGAGYFGVLYGSTHVAEAVKWLSFLSRDENMLALAEMSQQYSPSKGASNSDYFVADTWKSEVIKTLPFAHTSQNPSTAWSQIAGRGPGSPIYDFWANVLLNQQPIQTIANQENAVAQTMIDRANN